MARKSEESAAPVVTSLPLPSSDSVLVIDLPDGQKLLVGKMSHGTVIEVATWRGTGRPDSRTNRLMLGMSSSDAEPTSSATDAQEELVVDRRSIKYWIWLLLQIMKRIKDLSTSLFTKIKSTAVKNSKKSNAIKPIDNIEDDVQAWLNNLESNKSKSVGALANPAKAVSTTKRSNNASKSKKSSPKKGNSRAKG